MAISPDELLRRMAHTLRTDIAPSSSDSFAKTQAFMASVILTKLAAQLRTRDEDARAADRERRALVIELRSVLDRSQQETTVRDAVLGLERDASDASWNRLVIAIHRERDSVGSGVADQLLAHVRRALRARLDRALVYSA